jgi:hypothetical protein
MIETDLGFDRTQPLAPGGCRRNRVYSRLTRSCPTLCFSRAAIHSRIDFDTGTGRWVSWLVLTQTISPVTSASLPPLRKIGSSKVRFELPIRATRAPRPATAINPVLRDRQPAPNQNAISEVVSLCEGSGEWGLNVIRTIWLGFTFMIILAGAGSFRFAFGHFDAANASGIVLSEVNRTVGSNTVQDTLTKAERLPVAYVSPAPDAAELAKAAYIAAELLPRTSPAMVTPAFIDRRSQEAAPPVVRQTRIQKPKRKQPKPDAVASKSQPAADPKTCQLEEFDAFRWAFGLPTGCHT